MSTIEKIWEGLSKPIINEYSCRAYNYSNLYVTKDKNNNCGLLLSNNKGLLKKEYKNITVRRANSVKGPDFFLENCLIVINKNINSNSIFIKSISSHFEDFKKQTYSNIDIQFTLDRLEEITKNRKKRFNEIVGVWGELYLIKLLLEQKITHDSYKIINSWESPNGRSLIDFNFREFYTSVEVKTTIKQEREHHISDYNQVKIKKNYDGYLASISIKEDSKGDSCSDLAEKINSMLNDDEKLLLSRRIKIRGKSLCYDKEYSFITKDKGLIFVKFEDVPKPIISDNIFNMKWDILINNSKSIPDDNFFARFKF